MTNKETFMSFLEQARKDYTTSLEISKRQTIDPSNFININSKSKLKRFIYSIIYKITGDYSKRQQQLDVYLQQQSEYSKLNTGWGLRQYFSETHNTTNIVQKHLSPFKPQLSEKPIKSPSDLLWFPYQTTEGFQKRLEVIEMAIKYYDQASEDEVPFMLHGDTFFNLSLYSAVENGEAKGEYAMKVYDYINDNYDDFNNAELDDEG